MYRKAYFTFHTKEYKKSYQIQTWWHLLPLWIQKTSLSCITHHNLWHNINQEILQSEFIIWYLAVRKVSTYVHTLEIRGEIIFLCSFLNYMIIICTFVLSRKFYKIALLYEIFKKGAGGWNIKKNFNSMACELSCWRTTISNYT